MTMPVRMTTEKTDRPDRLDRIDRKILAELQANASVSIARLAERVGLSQTPCWKRVQKLERSGVIVSRVALVDPARIGISLTIFVEIAAPDHTASWREGFLAAVTEMPEVLEVYRMAGDVDYLLKVVASDVQSFHAFHKRLTEQLELRNVASHFAMERLKTSTAYPLNTSER
jgi:Lrp/AsnC family transcriptional regulator